MKALLSPFTLEGQQTEGGFVDFRIYKLFFFFFNLQSQLSHSKAWESYSVIKMKDVNTKLIGSGAEGWLIVSKQPVEWVELPEKQTVILRSGIWLKNDKHWPRSKAGPHTLFLQLLHCRAFSQAVVQFLSYMLPGLKQWYITALPPIDVTSHHLI